MFDVNGEPHGDVCLFSMMMGMTPDEWDALGEADEPMSASEIE